MTNSKINYKPLILDKLTEFIEKLPEYSVGDVFFSVFTQLKRNGIEFSKSSLLEITDKQIYSALDKAIKDETE